MRYDVDDDNVPIPENIPNTEAPPASNEGLYPRQSWGWDGLDCRQTANVQDQVQNSKMVGHPRTRLLMTSSSSFSHGDTLRIDFSRKPVQQWRPSMCSHSQWIDKILCSLVAHGNSWHCFLPICFLGAIPWEDQPMSLQSWEIHDPILLWDYHLQAAPDQLRQP